MEHIEQMIISLSQPLSHTITYVNNATEKQLRVKWTSSNVLESAKCDKTLNAVPTLQTFCNVRNEMKRKM